MAGTEEMDEKAKRMRALLSSFYGEDAGSQPATPVRRDTLQGINLPDFDSDRYMQSLVRPGPGSSIHIVRKSVSVRFRLGQCVHSLGLAVA